MKRTTTRRSSAKREPPAASAASARTDPEVIAYLRELEHPLKREIEAVRQDILAVSPEIREGIKWNVPSFRTTEFFATFHLRAQDRVQLVLHRGAKVKDNAREVRIEDPAGLLKWLATDRCLATLAGGKDFQAQRAALRAIVREWIRWV